MGFYKAISVAALGIASYALYKTGALNPVVKATCKASSKVADKADEVIKKAKDGYTNLRNEIKKEEKCEKGEVLSGEILSDNS